MPGGFMTCTAMFRSGARTGTEITRKKTLLIPKGLTKENFVYCVAVLGSAIQGIAARPVVLGMSLGTALSASAVFVSVSSWNKLPGGRTAAMTSCSRPVAAAGRIGVNGSPVQPIGVRLLTGVVFRTWIDWTPTKGNEMPFLLWVVGLGYLIFSAAIGVICYKYLYFQTREQSRQYREAPATTPPWLNAPMYGFQKLLATVFGPILVPVAGVKLAKNILLVFWEWLTTAAP